MSIICNKADSDAVTIYVVSIIQRYRDSTYGDAMKQSQKPSLKSLLNDLETTTIELQRAFRLRKLLLEELISSHTLVEKELLLEMSRNNKRSIFLLEETRGRFLQVEGLIRTHLDGYKELLTWDELRSLRRSEYSRSSYSSNNTDRESYLLTGTNNW